MTEGPRVVLVVDDDATNRLLLTRGLERDGHRARAVANGLQALKALRDELFDCVLLDVLMPEMDGYQVLEHIRSDPKLRHTPVALEDTESVIRCIEISRVGTRLIRKIPRPCRTSSSPREKRLSRLS
jgi:CheY-like chemotaxis protein